MGNSNQVSENDLYEKNFKRLKNEVEDDVRKQKDLPCSWIGRINLVKKAILPNVIPIKIST